LTRQNQQGKDPNMINPKSRPLNLRQRKFVENHILKNMSIAESVFRAGYSIASRKVEDASSYGCKLLRQDRVKAYVSKLREKSFEGMELSYKEKRAFLARAVRTSVSEIGSSSDLAQEMIEEVDAQGNVRRKVKAIDKLRAVEIDNKMSGDNFADREPQQSNPFMLIVAMGRDAEQFKVASTSATGIGNGITPAQPITIEAKTEVIQPAD
jgi:phage terminase small subunit